VKFVRGVSDFGGKLLVLGREIYFVSWSLDLLSLRIGEVELYTATSINLTGVRQQATVRAIANTELRS
jgi:hypothetical protein